MHDNGIFRKSLDILITLEALKPKEALVKAYDT